MHWGTQASWTIAWCRHVGSSVGRYVHTYQPALFGVFACYCYLLLYSAATHPSRRHSNKHTALPPLSLAAYLLCLLVLQTVKGPAEHITTPLDSPLPSQLAIIDVASIVIPPPSLSISRDPIPPVALPGLP